MDDHPSTPPPEPLLAVWIKWTMDFWESMADMGPGPQEAAGETEDFWQTALKMWQAFFSLLSEPETVAAVFRGINPPSEIILKMAQAGWAGYFHLHQQWLEGEEGQAEPSSETYGFENLDQDIFKICSEIYEQDFRQLLDLPQVGLTRLSRERSNRALDLLGQFQGAMAEFIYLLYLPLKKSLREIKPEAGADKPEEFKDYYRRWMKLLEGHYMTMFKSPEYTRTLSHTLDALEDFTLAKQELLASSLGALPIPSNRDMDELYYEVYLLKKQVKELAKKLAQLTPSLDAPEEP
jgi:polyhydroxyalkanoate synthase subunit PhaE